MIAVIDYKAGNILSVENALKRAGTEYIITSCPSEILNADKVILPGVGDAAYAMKELRKSGLDQVIKEVQKPLLGICLGMQLLCSHTEEGDTDCLSIFPNKVIRLKGDKYNKIPNIGWSEMEEISSPLFEGIKHGSFVYYVHSYGVEVNEYTICSSNHSSPFSGALQKNNFYGCQFHPEKSGKVGERIILNFIKL